ncbi:hypothetical protein BGZ96_000855 [Linnemannia gamsii]|uniref:BTB domain-containing protein n=1 Tax=Linnemannia gamsii TaxID=64522 RepID=A0ABQ7JNA3_9FUNG|nr:hypothetical protein BGZ96_000855 [Linnemannia gamsii]
MASSHLEMTLYIIAPKFGEDSSSHNITFGPGYGWAAGQSGTWKVTLTLTNRDSLDVVINWTRSQYHHFIKFQSMHIVPRTNFFQIATAVKLDWSDKGQSSSQIHTAQAVVPVASVLEADHYNFIVVFSTEPDLLRSFFTPVLTPLPAPTPMPELTPKPVSKDKTLPLSLLLLKDPSSVDICFIFSSDKPYSNLGLWAHRCILSQHNGFAELIQHAKTVQSLGGMIQTDKNANVDTDSDSSLRSFSNISIDSMDTATGPTTTQGMVGPASKELIIKVDKVSLATFCVLLYYIYTGEVNLTVDTGCFVLSDTNKASLVWRDSVGKVKDSINWRPLEQDSPWRLKHVTSDELLDASIFYGLDDLELSLQRV